MKYILQVVDEQLALNAVRGKSLGEKLTPQARVLVDMAKAGACGQPAADRKQRARLVREIGQFGDDAAASEALIELSQHLDLAEDSRDSHELCARAVGEAWRRHAPFRVSRTGDPLDVLTPHLTPAEAVLALDRARTLPPAPAAVLLRRSADLNCSFDLYNVNATTHYNYNVPYSRSMALSLLGVAESELRKLAANTKRNVKQQLNNVQSFLKRVRGWVESEELPTVNPTKDFLDLAGSNSIYVFTRQLRQAGVVERVSADLVTSVVNLAEYVRLYAELVDVLKHTSKLRAVFPEFYPEDES